MVYLSPDFLHKDGTSGGAPYGIELPCRAADAPWLNEWNETSFVGYLRICSRCGGFPGLAGGSNTISLRPVLSPNRARFVRLSEVAMPREHFEYLTQNLLSF